MKIKTTKGASTTFLDILVYGQSGVGKTRAISTLPGKVLILSAEEGTLSLSDFDIDMVEVKTYKDVIGALNAVEKKIKAGGFEYQWLALDSLSEIAEKCLAKELDECADGRMAYGHMKTLIVDMVRQLRDMPIHTYMIAKVAESGPQKVPGFPGQKLQWELPHHFDEVLAMHSIIDGEGVEGRVFQANATTEFLAKDRSGKLDKLERADLKAITEKILAPQGKQ